ncbi:MAG: energy transducer TonB [Pedobacter sp.]|nr:energy transducer TonB [Pedobacter sp.]MDQ8054481.1 energy transducer TonB [Pedobacter sp.]
MRIIGILLLCFSLGANAQKPELKGGIANFVQQHTIYPDYSRYSCIQGTIKVAIKLNHQGEIYQQYIADGLGIDLDDEALRVIGMSSGKWTVPQTYDTTAVLLVPVNFKLSGYGCERKTKGEIALAIQAYKTRENLLEVIANYYTSLRNGTAKAEDEPKILRIKEDLGIDEDYLDSRIEAGMKKYKQGDRAGACKEFNFVRNMGSTEKADALLAKYCN